MLKFEKKIIVNKDTYLREHCIDDVAVIPGTFYCQEVLKVFYDKFDCFPDRLSNIVFNKVIFILTDSIHIGITQEQITRNQWIYKFYEVNKDEQAVAEIKVYKSLENETDKVLKQTCDKLDLNKLVDSEEFYQELNRNGNNYGASFQVIRGFVKEKQYAAIQINELNLKQETYETIFMDSICQTLYYFAKANKTYVLKEIGDITFLTHEICDNALIHIDTINTSDNVLDGSVTVYDAMSRKVIRRVKHIVFHIQKVDRDIDSQINIVSNFTITPIEQTLDFWKKELNDSVLVNLCPYNLVFQELLDTNSTFGICREGINTVVLSLEEWYRMHRGYRREYDEQKIKEGLSGFKTYFLPNNLEIAHINEYETNYVYNEIFEEDIYLKHGIQVADGDTVIDIGANIGLFSLYINYLYRNVKIFSFEPSPDVYKVLHANANVYGDNIKTFNSGVSDCEKSSAFTFYENSTVFSSIYSDENEDNRAIKAIVRNMISQNVESSEMVDSFVDELIEKRLDSKQYMVQMRSISNIIDENKITRIDLLKIDAEKSELDILRGIREEHWPLIKQIVMEIHDDGTKVLDTILSMLDEHGFTYELEQDKFLGNSGLYNLYAVCKTAVAGMEKESLNENFKQICDEFIDAAEVYTKHHNVPLLVVFTPISPTLMENCRAKKEILMAEERLFININRLSNCFCCLSDTVLQQYDLQEYYDFETKKLGHIPYTIPYYIGLGTQIYRMYTASKTKPFKVLVLDCDNTIWGGNCGESKVDELVVSKPYLSVQQYALEQKKKGILLCICSKNKESDVEAVFQNRTDMLIKSDDIVLKKVNWNDKSDNVRELCEELNLSTESVVFLDDSPIECAQMRANLPEVTTIQLPTNVNDYPLLLKNLWVFDLQKVTEEDQNRTAMYKEQQKRELVKKQTISMKQFLEQLELKLDIREASIEDVERISQLTLRTNQFNFTTKRHTVNEVKRLLNADNSKCYVVNASDKFGDYGMVGVICCSQEENVMKIDTFLLSCRALGRGIEYQMLSFVAKEAEKKNIKNLYIDFIKNDKNEPANLFLNTIVGEQNKTYEGVYVVPVANIKTLDYMDYIEEDETRKEIIKQDIDQTKIGNDNSINIQKVSEKYISLSVIANAMDELQKQESLEITAEESVLATVLKIMQTVLKDTKITCEDNFFDVGGDSLSAVFVISRINKMYQKNYTVITMIESPTAQLLAEKIYGSSKPAKDEKLFNALKRGKRRNYRG